MPVITSRDRTVMTRRSVLASAAAVVLFGATRTGIAARQSTPTPQPTGEDNAVALLTEAATAMADLETFAFSVVTARGETTILEGFTVEEIAGVVRRPADFETTVTVEIPMATLDLTAVSIDGELWINLPAIGGESGGGWRSLGAGNEILSLLNPDLLILEAVRYVENATIEGEGEIDDVPVTNVTGTVDFRAIAAELLGTDEETALPAEIAEGPVRLAIAIDEESRVRQIEIMGPLLAAEAPDVIRRVTFSAFNEPVEIEEPDIGTTG